jgi:trk system potassium uptake protein TrkH
VNKQAEELRYAVRFRVVLKYFGQLCVVLAVLSLLPLVMSLVFGEIGISLRYGALVFVLAGGGIALSRLRVPTRVQSNEGLLLIALMFLFTPLVMSIPMMASGLGFTDAFFEAISAVTTTGLSTRATLSDAPSTFLFARAWMQWYGGLEIVVFSVVLVMRPGPEAKT